jgi:hypothetical protein
MRDARALRTLALLDLESHPPDAAIDRVTVAVDPTPGRVVQFSLLTRPLPSPEQLSTLTARLAALMGEGRCGSPALVDSWRPGAFAMKPFAPRESTAIHSKYDTPRHRDTEVTNSNSLSNLGASMPQCVVEVKAVANPVVALRRFRTPMPARVRAEEGRPVRVDPPSPGGLRGTGQRGLGGRVEVAAGPWRTSGAWWKREGGWDRDEWDVALADGVTYRLFRDRTDAHSAKAGLSPVARRAKGEWFIEGVVD